MRRNVLLFGAMQPVRGGRSVHPGMRGPGVVGYIVEQHLDAKLVRGFHQRNVIRQSSQMFVSGVVIDRAVAVVILLAKIIIVDDGREPDGSYAQVLQVGKVVANALEIATVIRPRTAAVISIAAGCALVVGWVAVGKAVRHDEVDDVVRAEAVESLIYVCLQCGGAAARQREL